MTAPETTPAKRPASKLVIAATIAGLAIIVFAAARAAMNADSKGDAAHDDNAPCGPAFFRRGPRCCPTPEPLTKLGEGLCHVITPPIGSGSAALKPAPPPVSSSLLRTCPAPLLPTPRGCDAPEHFVARIPETTVLIGPSDWEAEGRVKPRTVLAAAFELDRLEMTVGRALCPACPAKVLPRLAGRDIARAASYVTLAEARQICKIYGGRLPTEDEWIVAAAGSGPRRYPWGDTGAVCRRAAWGLSRGPCGSGATGPDTIGAHPDGTTPLGVYDLAGNVAEWVETGPPCDSQDGGLCFGVVRGGSYDTDLATELRTWVRREVPAEAAEATIGFRCAYDVGDSGVE